MHAGRRSGHPDGGLVATVGAGPTIDGTVELGAGRVLTGLSKRVLEGASAAALGTPEEIDAYVALLDAARPRRAAAG